ncbi:MAG: hypothetical protein K9J16_18700 [Melioribacteraceae bacterium]|nr:hypothetical protein [Melioribacteraceae bacterium]MCF8357104.1 hypothetical protein [Melioribacteraceae bacterium]MCF8396065.1 hypothetical protein [Melioribacteraceae bacterium]MCF8418964.1 hypothetical protein [Melioribacteraceae bacterium]
MKTKELVIVTVVLIGIFLFLGCNEKQETAEQDVKDASEDMMEAKAQYENEWQQFKSNVEAAIITNEQRIADLKKEMESTSDEFKTKYENKILTLEQKNIELKKKLNEYTYDGKEGWQKFKQEFSDDIDGLERSLNEIFENK